MLYISIIRNELWCKVIKLNEKKLIFLNIIFCKIGWYYLLLLYMNFGYEKVVYG